MVVHEHKRLGRGIELAALEPYAGSDLSAPARAAASATLAALSAVVLSIGSAVTRSRR